MGELKFLDDYKKGITKIEKTIRVLEIQNNITGEFTREITTVEVTRNMSINEYKKEEG